MSKLIFGCGYLGLRVARQWRDAGHPVFAVTRVKTRATALAAEGLTPIVADILRPFTLAGLPIVQTVLYAIGYDTAGGADFREVFVTGLQSALAALPVETGKLIYISTSGVYGQDQGEWVDEDAPACPLRERARACLDAERLLDAHPLGARAVTLRLAGLYGPGRIPHVEAIRAGTPLAVPRQGHLNLIHVDDAVQVVLAADARAPARRTYVVSDGHPVRRQQYYEEVARQLGAAPPQFIDPDGSSAAAGRAATDKRLNNARMLAELAVTLKHPTYRQGLAAMLA